MKPKIMETPANTKYSLKAFKYAKFASHETNCFSATVCYDGKAVGHAENDGQGGSTIVHLNEYGRGIPAVVAANKAGGWVEATEANVGKKAPDSLEEIVDALVEDLLTAKWVEQKKKKVAKDLATTVIFTKKGDKPDEYRTLAKKFATPAETLAAASIIHTKIANVDKVLNLLPFEDAFKMLVKVG